MQVNKLDHINIRTDHVDETLQFYSELLSVRIGPAPTPPGRIVRGGWIYDGGGSPVLHVGARDGGRLPGDEAGAVPPASGSGVVHHVAFECSGYDELVARLTERSVAFERNEVVSMNLRQIFLRDPNNILVELNFR